MLKYTLKRLFLSIFILLGVSIIIYALVRWMPNDYVDNKFASQVAQGTVKEEDLIALKELYGLNDGILEGYFRWLSNAIKGDFGKSFVYGKDVSRVISENMWISFFIAAVAMVFQFAISIPLGISSATHQYSIRDYSVSVLAMMGISLPSFFFSAILIRIFSVQLGWFPVSGLIDATKPLKSGSIEYYLDMLHHLILPMIVLVVLSIGGLMRHTRTNTLEVLNADYIRTARAKGLSEKKVIYKHAFRNTMIPLVTMMAGIIPSLFGGAMITEQVFAIPGIGNIAYKALTNGDVPFIMGYNVFLAVLTIIGTFLSDIMYMIVDPRVKLEK
jgi:peptide/nickel transport system permease protein